MGDGLFVTRYSITISQYSQAKLTTMRSELEIFPMQGRRFYIPHRLLILLCFLFILANGKVSLPFDRFPVTLS